MPAEQPNNPLHGITLKTIVETLVERRGWNDLGKRIPIRCFTHDPSLKSSLKFLRTTPWARAKVEALYLADQPAVQKAKRTEERKQRRQTAHGIAPPRLVVLREVAPTYASCLRSDLSQTIDAALAAEQHANYAAVFAELGIECEVLPADPAHPDSCFIEDTAVVWDGEGIVTNMGAEARRGEVAEVAQALVLRGLSVDPMLAPATLDGGDVLRVADTLFVGRSTRTNEAGVAFLRERAARSDITVVEVAVAGGLHLKSAATALHARCVVTYGDALDPRVFTQAGLEVLEALEPHGANLLALGKHVVMSSQAPRTAELVHARGFEVVSLDISELHKGDGALTCLSLRVPRSETWCA